MLKYYPSLYIILLVMRKECFDVSIYKSRGANAYFAMLFPEDPFPKNIGGGGQLARKFVNLCKDIYWTTEEERMTCESAKALASIGGKYTHYSLENGEVVNTPCSEFKIMEKFGGREQFFHPGTTILDMGCGVGRAVSELSKQYGKHRVKVIGLNLPVRPINPSSGCYVNGHWGELPFRDGTFDGILGCESFPAHKSRVSDEDTIREITKVSRVGTIWRATFPFDIAAFAKAILGVTVEVVDRRAILVSQMLNNGWDVYMGRRSSMSSFIAKLQTKSL